MPRHGRCVTWCLSIVVCKGLYCRYRRAKLACCHVAFLNPGYQFPSLTASFRPTQSTISVRRTVLKAGEPNEFINCAQAAGD